MVVCPVASLINTLSWFRAQLNVDQNHGLELVIVTIVHSCVQRKLDTM
jgi:hypothetical protein